MMVVTMMVVTMMVIRVIGVVMTVMVRVITIVMMVVPMMIIAVPGRGWDRAADCNCANYDQCRGNSAYSSHDRSSLVSQNNAKQRASVA